MASATHSTMATTASAMRPNPAAITAKKLLTIDWRRCFYEEKFLCGNPY